jgi:hypothetical protein
MPSQTLRISPLLLAAGLLFLGACGSTDSNDPGNPPPVESWIDNPGDIRDVLAVVGSAPILGNESAARTRAETNGRGQMASTLQTRIQALMSNWFKETGNMLDANSVSSYINDEGMVRQITNTELSGARAIRYGKRGNTQYVLLVLDDPSTFVKNVGQAVKDRAMKDETLLKTESMKREFENKMNELIQKDSANLQQKTEEFKNRYVGS